MTRNELWTSLDTACNSSDRSQSLLQVSDLLRTAYAADLPLLIACTRTPGRIHHSYANFDASNPDLAGNRYLICFSSLGQARIPTAGNAGKAGKTTPPVDDHTPLSLEERFRQIDEEASAGQADSEPDEPLSLEERFRRIDEGEDEAVTPKKRNCRRRKKKTPTAPTWTASKADGTATVSARAVLDYMRRNRMVGGLVFNVFDEKHAVALPKFMM